MTKASIVEDTITYIGELQKKVEKLQEKLHEIEETPSEIDVEQTNQMIKPERDDLIDLKEEMKKLKIEVLKKKKISLIDFLICFLYLS